MKLAVSMWSYFQSWKKGMSVPEFVREAKRAGADGVELLDFFYNDPDRDRLLFFDPLYIAGRRSAIKEALEETNLPVPIFSVANNFAKENYNEREQEVQKIAFGISEAVQFGAKVVRVFAGDVSETVSFDQARDYIVHGLAEASKLAAQHGVKLALENHGTLAGRGDQVRDLIEDVRQLCGNDALGANPDTGNFLIVGQRSDEAIRQVASLAYMVHFKDFKQAPADHSGFTYDTLDGKHLVGTAVGEGEVNLKACIETLKEGGFDGWLSVEYEGEEDPISAIPRSIENARKFL